MAEEQLRLFQGLLPPQAATLTVEVEDGIVTIAKGDLTIMGEVSREGDVITLSGAEIEGGGAGTSSRTEMRGVIEEWGRQEGARVVIVQGAKRSTGLHIGRFPRPYIIPIPPGA